MFVPLYGILQLNHNLLIIKSQQVYSSGQYKGKSKVSNKANKKVKALFHNGAMSAIQHCKELKEYRAANRYQRKVGEGKNEMLVINNVCNKLVHRIFACVSRREKYNENYIQTFA